MALRTKDDLPSVRATPRLISRDTRALVVEFMTPEGPVLRTVGATHLRLRHGGFFPLFVCPECSKPSRVLRLLDERVCCNACDGLLYRAQAHDPLWPAERVERLKATIARAKRRQTSLAIQLRRATIALERKRWVDAQSELSKNQG